LFAQLAQCQLIMLEQLCAGLAAQPLSVVANGERQIFFFRQLEKQQVSELLNVVVVIDAIVFEHIAEAPYFLYNTHESSFTLMFTGIQFGRGKLYFLVKMYNFYSPWIVSKICLERKVFP
jgi:hypothetical protein